MLLGKSKLGKFYYFYPTKYHMQLPNERFKKSWAHDTGQINVGQMLSNNLVIIAQLVG